MVFTAVVLGMVAGYIIMLYSIYYVINVILKTTNGGKWICYIGGNTSNVLVGYNVKITKSFKKNSHNRDKNQYIVVYWHYKKTLYW